MTREEAQIIIGNIPIYGDDCYTISEYQEAKAKAIEALARPERKKGKWIEKFDRIIRELGVNCAYDMPSFWCSQGKDYKVIPTKYHKGYMQALADVEKRMKEAEECPEKK